MNELHLIDLDQDLTGQRRFISCWTSLGGELNFVVDPGPPATAPRLIAALETLGVERLDFILLTHIHLDHGGAAAAVLKRWPAAQVVCHKSGRPHLVEPERLWEGSLKVLGRAAEVYGEPGPVPEDSLAGFAAVRDRGIEVIPTPGHAPHHVSTLGRGEDTEEYYLRPATPPRFFRGVAEESLDNLMELDPFPRRLCFAHHGRHAGDGRRLLARAREQLGVWLSVVAEQADALGGLREDGDEAGFERLLQAARPALEAADEFYARLTHLPEDIREGWSGI